jgi:hypothetical protein
LLEDNIPAYEHLKVLMDERDRRYEQRFSDQNLAVSAALASAEKAVQAALVAADRAVAKAELAADKRFDSVNEFRQQLNDQATQFMTRSEGSALIDRNTKDIQELKDRINTSQGRGTGIQAGWGYLIGAVGLAGGLVGLYASLH